MHVIVQVGHLAALLGLVLAIAATGRRTARQLRQPEVVGEITAGLLAGPVGLALLGPDRFRAALPAPVLGDLKLIGQVGLVLFLVGLGRHVRSAAVATPRTAVLGVSLGALVPPLLIGTALAVWVIGASAPVVRGTAPTGAFILMTAVALAVSAVPVMARILADRRMTASRVGSLSMTAAVVIDAIGWMLLTVAVSLASNSADGILGCLTALAAGAAAAVALRQAARSSPVCRLCSTTPGAAAVALAVIAVGVALGMEQLGMTSILGAALVAIAVPTRPSASGLPATREGVADVWAAPVAAVSRLGRVLVPVFFVSTGVTVFTGSFAAAGWPLIVLTVLAGLAGKVGGGYLGARLGGESPTTARRVAVLMNTRGLTELVFLHAGFEAGILTGPMMVALILMALATTALTGPLLDLLDMRERRGPVVLPASAAVTR